MAVRYKPDIAGTGKLMRSVEMQLMLRSAAEKGKLYAMGISPERTGEYLSSFSVETKADGGVHGDRAQATLVNNSPHAVYVEWQDNYHVLARTADYIERTGP
jgi:hypothetical protein